MADKYEDLDNVILEDLGIPEVSKGVTFGIQLALQWLDEHRDQAPGRTLTRGDMVEAFGDEYAGWATHRLARIGYTIAPAPKPTNAEKLADAITNAAHGVGIGSTTANIKAIAEHLDEAGVKAPGGRGE